MKFPYGTADFYKLRKEGYFYQDRTAYIHMIENWGDQLIFLRPRRFGKSLWLSVLENYYDVAKTNDFQELFGDLAIGQNPTPRHNQYFILRWDFSKVAAFGDVDQIKQSLYNQLNADIEDFARNYASRLANPINIHATDALYSFRSLLTSVDFSSYKLYLLIDEYDNFANEVAMGGTRNDTERYERMVTGDGILKTVFKNVKAVMGQGQLDRVFITGVSPMLLSDLTSGFNTAKNITLDRKFHSLCGFTENEVASLVQQVGEGCHYSQEQITETIELMRTYYNGYSFDIEGNERVYNPTLALYFLENWQDRCKPPRKMLDVNLSTDKQKLQYIASHPGGEEVILGVMNNDPPVSLVDIQDHFSLFDLVKPTMGRDSLISLLYYFGMITLQGENAQGDLQLQIPNLVTKELYFAQLLAMLLPDEIKQSEARQIARKFCISGNIQPLCDFIEEYIYPVFSNRDYSSANELTVKSLFLSVLTESRSYILTSETEAKRYYTDLLMLIRPEYRSRELLDILIEFKYLPMNVLELNARKTREMSQAELENLPEIQTLFQKANAQVLSYKHLLQKQHNNTLKLRAYTVISIGFERLLWQEV